MWGESASRRVPNPMKATRAVTIRAGATQFGGVLLGTKLTRIGTATTIEANRPRSRSSCRHPSRRHRRANAPATARATAPFSIPCHPVGTSSRISCSAIRR